MVLRENLYFYFWRIWFNFKIQFDMKKRFTCMNKFWQVLPLSVNWVRIVNEYHFLAFIAVLYFDSVYWKFMSILIFFFFIFTYFELGLLYFSAFFKVVSLITISNIFYVLNKAFWVAHFLKTEWKSNWKTLRELFLVYMYNWLLLLYLNKQGLVLQTKM